MTTGSNNVYVGSDAGAALNSSPAANNTCMGSSAGRAITTGSQNVLIGEAAAVDCSTGDNNVCLGQDSGRGGASGNIISSSNNVVLGNSLTANLYCTDTSISSSDSRDKTDVNNFTAGLSWIKALRPVTYRWDRRDWYASGIEGAADEFYGTPDGSKKTQRIHIGFLAQEFIEVEKDHGYGQTKENMLIVNQNEDESNPSYGIKYERLVPVLVNAIKELSAEVDQLKAQLNN